MATARAGRGMTMVRSRLVAVLTSTGFGGKRNTDFRIRSLVVVVRGESKQKQRIKFPNRA